MNNPYEPVDAVIRDIVQETPDIKTFKLDLKESFGFSAGQFVQFTVPGVGEFPLTPSSRPGTSNSIDVTVLKAGVTTESLHRMKRRGCVAVRGPYGNGFDIEKLKDRELLVIGGGRGLVQLKALIYEVIYRRPEFPRVILLYGAETPDNVLYKNDFNEWKNIMEIHRTVNMPGGNWNENTGDVTEILKKIEINIKNAAVVIAGTPLMMRKTTGVLEELGIPASRIYVSLEKNMTCGFGKCRRCITGNYYICKDGPVFSYDEIKNIAEVWE